MTCLYKISDPRMCSYSDCVSTRSCVYRDYSDTSKLAFLSPENTPIEVVNIIGKINFEIAKTGCELVAYTAYCSEGPDEVRIAIMHKDDGEVCRHLRPDAMDWHTLRILLDARFKWGAHQHNQGKISAVNTLATHFKTIVGAK